jgi:ADP-ribose pyrophosphatase YjhB (NUDIX family)
MNFTRQAAFWLTWPLLYVYFASSKRTRVLIEAEGKVLVVQGWLGDRKWSLPGGGLRRGEVPLAGLIREVREEVGLNLKPNQLKPLFSDTYKDKGIHFSYTCFVVQLPKQLPLHPHKPEIVLAQWLPSTSLSATNASPDVLSAVARWRAGKN